MRLEIGPPVSDDEWVRFAVIAHQALGFPLPDERAWLDRYQRDWFRLVRVAGEVVGGLVVLPLGQWFGGRVVPMAGIHAVAIAAEHRGGDLATRLMAEVMREEHGRGTPISTLFPATQPVYRRAGFEQAGTWTRYRLRAAAIDARDRALRVERVSLADQADLAAVYARRAAATAGNLDRDDWCWRRLLDPMGAEVSAFRVRGEGGTEGYLALAQQARGRDAHPFDLGCRDLVTTSAAATGRLLALLADHRSMVEDIVFTDAPVSALALHLREQAVAVDRSMRWMVRIVDVRAALEARGYAPAIAGSVDLEVRDEVLPANAGRWRLTVGGGRGQVEPGGSGALHCDVRGLAPLFSGYASAWTLAEAGLVHGSPEALTAASALFAGPAPWLPEIF